MKTKNYFRLGVLIVLLAGINACTFFDKKQKSENESSNAEEIAEEINIPETGIVPADFVPEGFAFFEEIYGDLNNDGLEDCALIIKGTDKNKFVKDEYQGEFDRNRRGIIILFNKEEYYEAALENYTCFSSENEDGGAYIAPDLWIYIENGNLYFHYGHGKYGYWKYTFRYKNYDFELIGYDISNSRGPVIESEVSMNFLTKKKLTRVNVSTEADEEVFEETWDNIKVEKLIKLSEITDFDDFDFHSVEI